MCLITAALCSITASFVSPKGAVIDERASFVVQTDAFCLHNVAIVDTKASVCLQRASAIRMNATLTRQKASFTRMNAAFCRHKASLIVDGASLFEQRDTLFDTNDAPCVLTASFCLQKDAPGSFEAPDLVPRAALCSHEASPAATGVAFEDDFVLPLNYLNRKGRDLIWRGRVDLKENVGTLRPLPRTSSSARSRGRRDLDAIGLCRACEAIVVGHELRESRSQQHRGREVYGVERSNVEGQ